MSMVDLREYLDDPRDVSWGEVVGLYNRIGRENVNPAAVKDFREEFDEAIQIETGDRIQELKAAGLSEREAQVIAMKEEGFTNSAIMTYLDLGARSTVDEYARRSRQKYQQAKRLSELLEDSSVTD